MIGNDRVSHAKLSVQRALLGAVSPNLRGVTCSFRERAIDIRFLFDGEVTGDNREAVSEVEGEVLSDYDVGFQVKIECRRYDAPKALNQVSLDWWAFVRRE